MSDGVVLQLSCCIAALRQLRSIRHLVSATVFRSLVTALVLSRLDYGNGTLIGLPIHLIRRLQSLQNAAARLIFRLRRSDHITDALISLHWLRVPERIVFKVDLRQFTSVADIPIRQRLWSSTSDDLCVPAVRLATVGRRAFSSLALVLGTPFLHADVTSAPYLLTFRKRLHYCVSFHFPILALYSK